MRQSPACPRSVECLKGCAPRQATGSCACPVRGRLALRCSTRPMKRRLPRNDLTPNKRTGGYARRLSAARPANLEFAGIKRLALRGLCYRQRSEVTHEIQFGGDTNCTFRRNRRGSGFGASEIQSAGALCRPTVQFFLELSPSWSSRAAAQRLCAPGLCVWEIYRPGSRPQYPLSASARSGDWIFSPSKLARDADFSGRVRYRTQRPLPVRI